MKVLLDTDVISALMRRDTTTRLRQRLARVPLRSQCTSAINLGELAYGARRAGRPQLFDTVRELLVDIEVLPFDAAAADVYGKLRADLERRGRVLAEADLRIASIALSQECTVVTGNVRHFSRIDGLVVENWLVE